MVSYAGKLCLAPMVRSGELPTRLMALRYGADLVWLPEIIDRKIMSCTRHENTKLGTVDFLDTRNKKSPTVVFRTARDLEKNRLIFQLGSADPKYAVEGALNVINDVDGIDLNCGCPKPFSTHAGMGAALLSTPDLLCQILTELVQKVGEPHNKPISAKIRLLHPEDPQPTLDLVRRICLTGVTNLTVHCRTREMRNRDSPIREFVSKIYDVVQQYGVSLVINGGFKCKSDFKNFQQSIGLDNVGGMLAEAAESNPSVFSDAPLPWRLVVLEFIKLCIDWDNHPSNTKYILLNQLPGKSEAYKSFCKVKNNVDYLRIAEEIGDEGNKVFIRTMQKDKQYDPSDFTSNKRPADAGLEKQDIKRSTIST